MFTDTHLHLFKEYYDDINEVLDRSIKNNVNRWINNASNGINCKEVLESSKNIDNLYCALGIHPESVFEYTLDDIKYIEDNINNDKVVAIGEIGLDYYYTKDNKKEQILLFEKMLELAEKYNKPVIIHSRDATQDTLNIIKKYKVKGTIHSFSGSLETAKEYIKLGYLIGVNGVITFKNANIKNVIKELPLESLVLETDSPYLSPEPYRGTKNEPSHILDIANFVCELKGISLEELADITSQNIKNMYNI